jgi:hypothetical protein
MYDTVLRITDDDDISCHLHPLYCRRYNIVDATIINVKEFIETITRIGVNSANGILLSFISSNGNNVMRINLIDINGKLTLFDITCDQVNFKKFTCNKKKISVNIDLSKFVNSISNFNGSDHLTFIIYRLNEDSTLKNHLLIKTYNYNNNLKTRCFVNLIHQKDNIKLPTFTKIRGDVCIMMKTSEFIDLCYNMEKYTNMMQIECLKNKVVFTGLSHYGNIIKSYSIKSENNNSNVISILWYISKIHVKCTFALKKLTLSNKYIKSCDNVILYLKHENFIIVNSKIEKVGTINYCINK